MHYIKKILVFNILLLICINSHSQFLLLGQDSYKIDWKQINTLQFRLIYDSKCELLAQKYAQSIQAATNSVGFTLGVKPKKVNYIIHNHTVLSNGLTNFAPAQVHLFATSPQHINSQLWEQQLVIHEMRHVVQNTKINTGFTKFLSLAFGQAGAAIAMANIHPWFYEGDAVVTETALSNSGRGRDPAFEMHWRALLLNTNNNLYSYQKAIHGSYKNYVPNHYYLGYLLTAFNRQKYGNAIWDSALLITGKYPFIFPFSNSLSKTAKNNQNNLYKQTFTQLKSIWENQQKLNTYTNYTPLKHKKNSSYTNYNFVEPLNNNCYVALKSGMGQLCQIVSFDSLGTEKVLYTLGNTLPNRISAANNIIVWDEVIPHIRWQNQNYSVIKMYNIKTGKTEYVSHKSKYFAPSLNTQANTIATIECDTEGNNWLVLIFLNTEKTILKFKAPNNCSLQMPTFNTNGNIIVTTAVNNLGKTIYTFNLQTQIWNKILPEVFVNISEPIMYDNFIYFRASYSGIENIYAYSLHSKKVFQVTSSKFGAFNPKFIANTQILVYSEYTSHGFSPVIINVDSLKFIPIHLISNNGLTNSIPKNLVKTDSKFMPTDTIFQTNKYNYAKHLINIHSWSPFYVNVQQIEKGWQSVKPGFLLYSQNPLSTLVLSAGTKYTDNNLYSTFSASYMGLFPIINFNANIGGKPQIVPNTNTIKTEPLAYMLETQVIIPLNLSRNKWQRAIQPYFIYNYQNIYHVGNKNFTYTKGQNLFGYGLYTYNYYMLSVRDIYPRFGQMLNFNYYHAPFQKTWYGYNSSISVHQFLPGIFKNHSIQLNAAYYLQNNPTWFRFFIQVPFNKQNYFAQKLRLLGVKYHFPVTYPDWSVSNVFYIKRLRANVGYSNIFEKGTWNISKTDSTYNLLPKANRNENYISHQLFMDFYFMHFAVPISVGVSFNYFIEKNALTFTPIFEVNLYPF